MHPKNTIEAIKTRYSCRVFTAQMPLDEHLQTIAQAAVSAPSALNQQPWRVIIVKNRQILDELELEALRNIAALEDLSTYDRVMSRGGKVYYNAPCQILIPIESPRTSKWSGIDCGIISQNIALAAASLGVDSLICGMISFSFVGSKRDYFKERFGFPAGYDIGLSVLLGYADESGVKPPHEADLSKILVIE